MFKPIDQLIKDKSDTEKVIAERAELRRQLQEATEIIKLVKPVLIAIYPPARWDYDCAELLDRVNVFLGGNVNDKIWQVIR
jgi:hypothetical protein